MPFLAKRGFWFLATPFGTNFWLWLPETPDFGLVSAKDRGGKASQKRAKGTKYFIIPHYSRTFFKTQYFFLKKVYFRLTKSLYIEYNREVMKWVSNNAGILALGILIVGLFSLLRTDIIRLDTDIRELRGLMIDHIKTAHSGCPCSHPYDEKSLTAKKSELSTSP